MLARFKLNKFSQRPMLDIFMGRKRFPLLLDTGAEVPVFTLGGDELCGIGGTLVQKNVAFTGFGGRRTGDLFRIDLNMRYFKYIALPIICIDDPDMPYAFVLSATMFSGFTYTIDDKAKMLTIDAHSRESERRMRSVGGAGEFRVLTAEGEERRDEGGL